MTQATVIFMRTLDLFSGVGGFALGLEQAGFETAAFCEQDNYCQRVLRRHWPDVPIYEDVRELNAERLAADGVGSIELICGGFPCQDISQTGKKAGIDGERSGLWREFARLIGELGPRYVIIENVPDLRKRGLERVLADLSACGYDAEWEIVSAREVGGLHLRARLFLVAYRGGERGQGCLSGSFSRLPELSWVENVGGLAELRERSDLYAPLLCGADDGIPHRVDRLRCVGNAILPGIARQIGEKVFQHYNLSGSVTV